MARSSGCFSCWRTRIREKTNQAIPCTAIPIKEINENLGFELSQEATFLLPVDFQSFVKTHVPTLVKELIIEEDPDDRVVDEAISHAISVPGALGDIKHRYGIIPNFSSFNRQKQGFIREN